VWRRCNVFFPPKGSDEEEINEKGKRSFDSSLPI
jgi:hypothetical protein